MIDLVQPKTAQARNQGTATSKMRNQGHLPYTQTQFSGTKKHMTNVDASDVTY